MGLPALTRSLAFVSADWGVGPDGEYTPGGSGFARCHVPARELTLRGQAVPVAPQVAAGRDRRLVPVDSVGRAMVEDPPDVVVCQRWMSAEAPGAIRAARAAGQVVLQDLDDWFWGLDPRNQAHRATDARVNPANNRDHYQRAMQASDGAIVSTGFLARRLRERMGVQTAIVRNVVDTRLFVPGEVRDCWRGLTVGWVGGLAWRSGDLETLAGHLGPWLDRTSSQFVHHGARPDHDRLGAWTLLGLRDDQVLGWRPMAPAALYPTQLMTGMDVGLVPLSNQPFNHAKSWIKGLEYAAAGIPFVAFRTREYELLGCGLLYSTPEEFVAQMDRMTDPDLRAEQRQLGLGVADANCVTQRVGDWPAAVEALAPSSELVPALP